ncbi:hypothetical protein OUZ56_025275 [Daphnia magna]|uniref:Uncharacterized protein n=1 Tax=Daphnia magna TaxID=35525 RepID=A0ABQ9ZJH4_9CRUS|nr:hypothetical protein OUZ56_025275 [Daphnia magna]
MVLYDDEARKQIAIAQKLSLKCFVLANRTAFKTLTAEQYKKRCENGRATVVSQMQAEKQLLHHGGGTPGFRQREGGTKRTTKVSHYARSAQMQQQPALDTTMSHVHQTRGIKENALELASPKSRMLSQRDNRE